MPTQSQGEESVSPETYLAQCISGEHMYEVVPGTELEAECIARANAGILDAFILGYYDCPDCIEEERMGAARFAESCYEVDCPMSERCESICLAVLGARSIPASKYNAQLKNMEFVGSVTGVFLNSKPLYL